MTDIEYAEQFAKLINVPTVTNSGDEVFAHFREVLREVFPLAHETMEMTICGENALLYKWTGKSDKKPIVLMGHQDVVPADVEGWDTNPFEATIKGDRIYGRGTLDCKNCLYMNLRTIEELIAEGYTPDNDVYVVASDNEETMGDGTPHVVEELKKRGVRPYLVLDEGGAIIPQVMPGMDRPYAMIGVLEKGYADFKFTAKSNGGHSSRPPKNTPVARLSKFIAEVEDGNIFVKKMAPEVAMMLGEMSKSMHGALKTLLGNLKITKPLVTKVLPKASPEYGNALLSTTCVFTQTHASDAANVIPAEAYAIANLRFAPHQGKEACLKALREVAEKYDITVECLQGHDAFPPIDTNNEAYKFLTDNIKKAYPKYGVAPYVIMVGTDCRHMQAISDCALRFTPMTYEQDQMNCIHGNNENLSIACLAQGITFTKELIKQNTL